MCYFRDFSLYADIKRRNNIYFVQRFLKETIPQKLQKFILYFWCLF